MENKSRSDLLVFPNYSLNPTHGPLGGRPTKGVPPQSSRAVFIFSPASNLTGPRICVLKLRLLNFPLNLGNISSGTLVTAERGSDLPLDGRGADGRLRPMD